MLFPPQFLEELRARLPLSEVVAKRVRLTRAGREYKAPCPFHNEKTPSFYVNDQKGFFHCFGCGAHGDIIAFTMRNDNTSFPEAVEYLSGLAGLSVPRASEEDRRVYEKAKTQYDLLDQACRWFEAQLSKPGGAVARDYLARRGVGDDVIARFRLGYAPQDRGLLRQHLVDNGFAVDDMVQVGLLKRPDDGSPPFSFFRHRVLFPVADRQGRVVAFGGRILDGDGPKYINTGETPLFHKGSLLYGLSRARGAAADGKPVVVAEGYMDVIALVEAGFPGAVAPLGTALTETQIQVLWKLIPSAEKEPILCFDGDGAGRRAAWRAVDRILPHLAPGQTARVAFMPEGEDPDSLIRTQGTRGMETVLGASIPFAEALWRMVIEGKSCDTPEAKAAVKREVEAQVDRIADANVQSFYRAEMRRRVADAFAPPLRANPRFASGNPLFRVGQRPIRHTPGQPGRRTAPPPGQGPASPRRLVAGQARERLLIAALINHPELYDEVGEALGLLAFPPGPLDALRGALLQRFSHGTDDDSALDAEALCRHLCSNGFETVMESILGDATFVRGGFARPEADLGEVRVGWWHTWEILRGRGIRAELKEAEQALKRESNETNLARVVALETEIAQLGQKGLDDGAGSDDGPPQIVANTK